MFELTNRVAVITGGANGIGRETARTFARAGAAVAIWDLAEDPGQALAGEIESGGGRAAFFKVNVASQTDVNAAAGATLERFRRVDILINRFALTFSGWRCLVQRVTLHSSP